MMLQHDMFNAAVPAISIAHDPRIEAAVRAGAVVVFNLSGGKDCGAAAALTIAWLDSIGHPPELRLAIHADLGRAEWESTPAQVEAQAHALGLRLVVVSAAAGDLVDRFEDRWRTTWVLPLSSTSTMKDAIRADVLPADVSRYTNHPHVKRIQVGLDGLVRQFDSWDGESFADDYFDRRACAEAQGYASAQSGHRYTWRKPE